MLTPEQRQIVKRARDRIAHPAHWCRRAYARTADGFKCRAIDPQARSFCAVGALAVEYLAAGSACPDDDAGRVGHPDAVRRAATLADGWMGSGGSSIAEFKASVPILKQALEAAGRDPAKFPASKRVFMAVDERPAVARRELERWFTDVYHNPPGTDASGIRGTPEQVRERLEDLVAAGANHLLLNPISRHAEQLEAVAELAGLNSCGIGSRDTPRRENRTIQRS